MALAHEGNPKEDSITIKAGEVTSTATLTIPLSPGGGGPDGVFNPGVPPSGPVPCGVEQTRLIEDCALGLRVIDRYDIGSLAGNVLHGSFTGCSGTPPGGFAFQPTATLFDLDIVCGRADNGPGVQGDFAGFSIVEGVINASHLGDFLSANTLYTVTSGAPVIGFCFWVDIDSTPCNFTGVVAINDVPNSRTYLGYFIGADLHSDPPTILDTGTLCPSDEVLSFFTDVSSNTFELSKTSGLLLSSSNLNTIVPTTIDNQPNWGFIWLPNSSVGVHMAKLRYGFSAWDIS